MIYTRDIGDVYCDYDGAVTENKNITLEDIIEKLIPNKEFDKDNVFKMNYEDVMSKMILAYY